MENKDKKKRSFIASLLSFYLTKDSKSEGDCGCAVTEEASSATETTLSEGGIKEIRVLGPGCAKCRSTFAVVEKVVRESGLHVRLVKVDDIVEIMSYDIMTTPAIVIDGKVVTKGRVPTEEEVRQLLHV